MAMTFRIKRGKQATLPALAEGEPGYATDTKRLYIGNGTDNTEIVTADVLPTVDTLYENAGGYGLTYEYFMTADPSLYDHFIVTTSVGIIPVYRDGVSSRYLSGGIIRTVGGGTLYIDSICFSPTNSTTGSTQWMIYELMEMNYLFEWQSRTSAFSIYKIEGVRYTKGLDK